MSLTSSKVDELSADLKAALSEVGKKHGLSIGLSTLNWSPTSFNVKVQGLKSATGEGDDFEHQNFKQHCNRFGLNVEYFGRNFTYQGSPYKVVGIRPRSRKYPILCENENTGTRYKFTVSLVASSVQP